MRSGSIDGLLGDAARAVEERGRSRSESIDVEEWRGLGFPDDDVFLESVDLLVKLNRNLTLMKKWYPEEDG